MIPGLNHNVRFKGKIYHVQTEDSGLNKPHITTILYEGGTILARKRTSYADILSSEHLEAVVRDLMKKQHKEMLKILKSGQFGNERSPATKREPGGEPSVPENAQRSSGQRNAAKAEGSLDEVILDYLTSDPDKKGPSGESPR